MAVSERELFAKLRTVEIKTLPPRSQDGEINLLGEGQSSAGIRKLIKAKEDSISYQSARSALLVTVITLFLGVFLVVPEKLNFNSTIKNLVANDYFDNIWIVLFGLSLILWGYFYYKKIYNANRRIEVERLRSLLKLNVIQNDIFFSFKHQCLKRIPPKVGFNQQEFTEYLLMFVSLNIQDTPDVDSITSFVLKKASDKGIITTNSNKKNLYENYTFNK